MIGLSAYKAQYDFMIDKARYPAFIAGRGSGKTAAGAMKAVAKALQPGARGIIAAPSFPMLEQAAKPEFLRFLDAAAKQDRRAEYYLRKAENKLVIPRLNSEILFVTLENYDRVRGINSNWGWIDEAGYIVYEAWRVMVACVRIPLGGKQPQLFVTSTPKGRNWLYDRFVVKPTADPKLRRRFTLHKATSRDNPFIDKFYVEGLGYEGRFYQQEILGEFVGFEGLVYPAFDRESMTARATSETGVDEWTGEVVDTTGWWSVIGADVGTRNPTAVITLRVHPDQGRLHQAAEFYQAGLGSKDIVDAIEQAWKMEAARGYEVEGVYLDPSAAAYLLDLRERDVPVYPANNDIITGLGRVTSVLGTGFTIDPSCVQTANEYESYHYPDGATRTQIDKPIKAFDHALDATRYAIATGLPHAMNSVGVIDEAWAEDLVNYVG